jgi:hypothetical protein
MKNKKIFLLLNHIPTEKQKKDLADSGVSEFVEMPEELKQIWQNIAPEKDFISESINPLKDWLKNKADKDDLIWIQGEHGATFNLVSFCFKNNLVPMYSTSIRCIKEEKDIKGSIKTVRFFTHARFRNYEE